jgi:CRP/FNR family transcriptional regulator
MLSVAAEDIGSLALLPELFGAVDDVGVPLRTLARDETLYEPGDLKSNIFRIEAGAICVYSARPDLGVEVVEYALAGDLVGMGFLERHATGARATVETKIRCFPLDMMSRLAEQDERAKTRLDEAVQREFAYRRDSLVSAGRERPLVRLAAYLTAVSRRNRQEGRDPTLIDDAVDCAVVSDYLAISVDLLALALVQLEMQGLVQAAPRGSLRLIDLDRLEAMADETGAIQLQSDLPGDRQWLR